MRVLISGGAGCLGSNLVDRYLQQGCDVFVIDNFATSRPEALPQHQKLKVVSGTIADASLVDAAFDEFKPTHVVHSAASYKDPNNWREDADTNVIGTINMIHAAKRHNVKRFVYFQTALCYGRPEFVPIPVDHKLSPFTSYGISKTAGERYVLLSGLSAVSLRLANITGPKLSIGPIPTFYKRLKAKQKCFCSDTTRDFLDMSDFFSIMDVVMNDNAPSGVFNVSSGEGHTIKDIFDIVLDHLKMELPEPVPVVPPGADDVPAVVLDPSETFSKLGWKSIIGFEETIRKMLAWYDIHGVHDIYSHLSRATKKP